MTTTPNTPERRTGQPHLKRAESTRAPPPTPKEGKHERHEVVRLRLVDRQPHRCRRHAVHRRVPGTRLHRVDGRIAGRLVPVLAGNHQCSDREMNGYWSQPRPYIDGERFTGAGKYRRPDLHLNAWYYMPPAVKA